MPYKPGLINLISRQMAAKSGLIYFMLALLTALGALLIGHYIFADEYITTDEHSYLFEAGLLAKGKLSLSCPPLTDAFFHRMIICDDQAGWVSRYPPAQILWLIPGVMLGEPRIMTAVAAFLSVWFLIKAGRRLGIPGGITALLLLISPYFWLMQGTVLSHTSALAATALMIWAYLVWIQERKISFAVIAGLAWAFLFMGRSYTAIWIALPFAIDALIRLTQTRTRPVFLGTLGFALSAGTGIAAYLIYNYLITGDALLSTYLYYDASDTLGFGLRHGRLHTPELGWQYFKDNVSALNTSLWGFKGSLWVWLALALFGWRKRVSALLLAIVALVWLAYIAFWFPGISEIESIYYYETLVFMILSAGMGVNRLFSANWPSPAWSKPLAAGVLIVVISSLALRTFNAQAQVIQKRLSHIHAMSQAIHSVPSGAIVIVDKWQKWGLVWNPQGIDSDPMVARDVYGVALVLPRLFPDRSLYALVSRSPAIIRHLKDEEQTLRIITATRTAAKTGKRNKAVKPASYLALESEHKPGLLSYRVRQYMLPGAYEITYVLKADGQPKDKIGHINLLDTQQDKILQTKRIKAGDRKVVLRINIFDDAIIEPQLYFDGSGRLEFERIEIRLIDTDPGAPKPAPGASAIVPSSLLPLLY